jgi:hypothetical protein
LWVGIPHPSRLQTNQVQGQLTHPNDMAHGNMLGKTASHKRPVLAQHWGQIDEK